MNADEFREAGKQMIDYIADYLENIRERKVLPSVEPNYIRSVVPADPPQKPEKWDAVFGDIEKVVMDGMTHWHSPYFYAYFPTGNSYPGILGGMLSDALSCIGFTWFSSPACTELEMQMCDWMAKVLGLPERFMFNKKSDKQDNGGGVIQGSMSECTFVTMLSAKRIAIEKIRRAILKTVEFRTKEEQRHEEQRNQKLKQGFLSLLKDVIKVADQIQDHNKFLNRNQLKDETTRLINSLLNKKGDKTQETVNGKLTANGVHLNGCTPEPAKPIEKPTDTTDLVGKMSKWNLNTNPRTANNLSTDEHKIINGKLSNGDQKMTNGDVHHQDSEDGENHKNNLLNDSTGHTINGVNGVDAALASKLIDTQTETILDLHLQYLILTDKSFSVETARLVVYCSAQAHSSVEKAALLASVIVRKVEPTANSENDLGLDGLALEKAILKDLECGLVPFYVCATLGTTSSLAFDKLDELGPIAKKYDLWLHVDAAYAGSAFVCPEYRNYLEGIEFTDSFAMNPHKWLLVNFDCSILWLKDAGHLDRAMNVSPAYLKHDKEGEIPDYRHWQVPLGRRFRSLKIWFVLRLYGVSGLQSHIRKQINLAIAFSNLIKKDERFELTHPVVMGLVCFRVRGSNESNERLVNLINNRKNIHIMSTVISSKYIIRFAICSRFTELSDIEIAFSEISTCLDIINKSRDRFECM